MRNELRDYELYIFSEKHFFQSALVGSEAIYRLCG